MHDDFCNMPGALFSNMLAYTQWRRRRNALGAPCALCAHRRCAVTTQSLHATGTPWSLRYHAVSRRSELCGSAVARRGRSSETPLSSWARRDISMLWKNVKLFAIFSSIFVRSHGALRNFKSPCQRRGVAVECDRGFTKEVCNYLIGQRYENQKRNINLDNHYWMIHSVLQKYIRKRNIGEDSSDEKPWSWGYWCAILIAHQIFMAKHGGSLGWFRQAIIWTNVDPDLCRHVVSLGQNELIFFIFIFTLFS